MAHFLRDMIFARVAGHKDVIMILLLGETRAEYQRSRQH